MNHTDEGAVDLELLKYLLEYRARGAAQHVKTYGMMLTLNLSLFAAAFAYLTQSENPVGTVERVFMVFFGLFFVSCWKMVSGLDLDRLELVTEEIERYAALRTGLPREFERIIFMRRDASGKNVSTFDEKKRVYAIHLPSAGLAASWVGVALCFGPGGLLG